MAAEQTPINTPTKLSPSSQAEISNEEESTDAAYTAIMKILLEAGADATLKNHSGDTVRDLAGNIDTYTDIEDGRAQAILGALDAYMAAEQVQKLTGERAEAEAHEAVDAINGLSRRLEACGLCTHSTVVGRWCNHMGAESLDDLVEEMASLKQAHATCYCSRCAPV